MYRILGLKYEADALVGFLKKYAEGKNKIIDVGCGYGRILRLLSKSFSGKDKK